MTETERTTLIGKVYRAVALVLVAKFPALLAAVGISTNDAADLIIYILGTVGVFGWSWLQGKMLAHRTATALVMPSGSTDQQITTVIMETSPGALLGPVPSPETAAAIVQEAQP